jgi:NADH:ubiquinone oxidoreductase subunit F (NADH-binding)
MTPTSSRVGIRRAGGSADHRADPPEGPNRLLSRVGDVGVPVGLDEHLRGWGALPPWEGTGFIDVLERSGLRGHGGGWFPVGTKWRSVRRAGLRAPVVVANGAEGEPASGKDKFLIRQLPHLVLDGAVLAAACIGAPRVLVHVPSAAVPGMQLAIEERSRRRLDDCIIETVVAPDRFLAGQESAVVNTINGRTPGIPSFVALRSVRDAGVGGRPTLVQNVESLAHTSLIARFGAEWFRRIGTDASPGTALLTVTGRWSGPRIVEAALGAPLAEVLSLRTDVDRPVQGVLLGGYGGGWVTTAEAMSMPLTEEAARDRGSSIGPGVVVLLPSGVCPLFEVGRVVRYLAGERAGQCGPCDNGLEALASTVDLLATRPRSLGGGVSGIEVLCDLIEGRGACRHPDGAVRFVRTALRVFGAHALLHLQRGPCHTSAPPFLAIPPTRRNRSR